MKTIHEDVRYTVEYRGANRVPKMWGFRTLAEAQEMFAEKADEGKRPRLFLERTIVTREQVYVGKDDWKTTRDNCS